MQVLLLFLTADSSSFPAQASTPEHPAGHEQAAAAAAVLLLKETRTHVHFLLTASDQQHSSERNGATCQAGGVRPVDGLAVLPAPGGVGSPTAL